MTSQALLFGGEISVGKRRDHDYYATPRSAVEPVLPFIRRRGVEGWVLEPGAGHGAIAVPLVQEGYRVYGMEIRPDGVAEVRRAAVEYDMRTKLSCFEGDYLEVEHRAWNDVRLNGRLLWSVAPKAIIGNPPFKDAVPFILKSLELLGRGGFICFLLPLSFLATGGRRQFWRDHPADVLVLDERPDFTGQGGANAEYGWFFWPPAQNGRGEILRDGDAGRRGNQ